MSGTSPFTYAIRTLAKDAGFSLAVLLSLVLGIGANAAIFSVVNGLLFHPAGTEHPETLVAPRVNYKKLGLDRISMSATDFADVRASRQIFSKAALEVPDSFTYNGGDSPRRLEAALVSWQWFDVFGRQPLLGRGFTQEEDQPGASHVVMLSYPAWKRLFGGDRGIIGRTIQLNNAGYRVTGVMPPDFRFPFEAEIWIPVGLPAKAYGPDNRFNEDYFVVARLAPGVSYARAASAIQALSNRVLSQVPFARGSQWSMGIEPFTEYSAGDLKLPALILLGAVGLVLLIACCNIAGLMLVRGTARARELAIRSALGASRADLIRTALVETGLLSLTGTALGLAAAYSLTDALVALANVQLSSGMLIRIDGHVLAFTALLGVVAALLSGLVPAWHVSRLGQQYEQLKEGGRSDTETHHRARLRSALVAGQIALALVLLVGAGLLLRTLGHLRDVNPGFDPKGVVTATVALPANEYSDPAKQAAFLRAALTSLSQTPMLTSVGAANVVPFAGGDPTASFGIEGRIVSPGSPGFHGSDRYVSPDYFKTLRIPLLAGRYFNDGDRKGAQPVAIIDIDLARKYWPNQNPLGQRIQRGGSGLATIVGIVGHVKQTSLASDSGRGAYYFCLYQQPREQMFFAARGNASSAYLAQAIRKAVGAADPAQAVFDVKTIEERISLALGPQQFAARILIAFAAAALFLAALGLYGVISYSVTRRTREIGIRTALGAQRGNIFAVVIGQAFRLVAAGLIAGIVAAAFLARFARSELFEVNPLDPATFLITACVLAATALLAVCIPAWRAMRVDPLVALRNE
ncbi:MAG TPA: ABC transporter permease [Bryobacteraceae bacterium]|jgi:predicted permease|nr:ABC transporter permease [Bryobacteraceae bacterium]